ncbi:hypothetical protein PEDI_31800 [Persicobacter diffluens]|uniref:Uncharacterized protein n=2 Tax=Persicobacter diffluens TaxID=981 RepID=A0AAN4W0Z8_9BACT|nr:hypothetical protein PEDI_31800 [Persicobacter diffluens]
MRYLLIFLFAILSNAVNACDCIFEGDFFRDSQLSELVVFGEVIDYNSYYAHSRAPFPTSISFLIKEKLRGTERRDTITVFGDLGYNCRPYISKFAPKTEWVLAMTKMSNEKESDYEISSCGAYYLQYLNGEVISETFGKERLRFPYDQVVNLVRYPALVPYHWPAKYLDSTEDGLSYFLNCDVLPKSNIPNRRLADMVKRELNLPPGFLEEGDSYLFLVKGIVDERGHYRFNGFYRQVHFLSFESDYIGSQLKFILENTGGWLCGLEGGEKVAAEVVTPILIERRL